MSNTFYLNSRQQVLLLLRHGKKKRLSEMNASKGEGGLYIENTIMILC